MSRVPVPAASSSADSEELIRAKAKFAQAGLTLTPRKPAGEDEALSPSKENPAKSESSGGLPVEKQRGTQRKADEDEPSNQVRKLLTRRAINSLKDNRPKSVTTEHVEAWMQTIK